jgi:hypothetical protein
LCSYKRENQEKSLNVANLSRSPRDTLINLNKCPQ